MESTDAKEENRMGSKGNGENAIKGTAAGWMGLAAQTELWKRDKEKAELMGLEWMMIQNQRRGGKPSVKYVTLGSILVCSCGTQYSRIQMPQDHGVVTKEGSLPIATVDDFKPSNIVTFGFCKRAASVKSQPCVPSIKYPWIQSNNTVLAGGLGAAALLQANAVAVCGRGGLICVKEVNKIPQRNLSMVLCEHYGFDERTVGIIWDVHQAIQAQYPHEKQIKRDWRFTRLIGGLRYGLEKDGGDEVFRWNQTAGDATRVLEKTMYYNEYGEMGIMSETDLSVKDYMVGVLGISGEDYEYLQYKVRVQNYFAGRDADAAKYEDKSSLEEDEKFLSKLNNMTTGLGRALTEEEFMEIWNQQCDDMCGKADFAHQQITTAAILATAVSEDGWMANLYTGGRRKREQMAGWLGDATLFGSDGKPPSFGNDDYMADLDAENLGYMVRNEGYSYIEAAEDYYERRLQEDSRAELFLENNSLEDVKQLIYEELVFLELRDKLACTNDYEERKHLDELLHGGEDVWLNIVKEKAPNTYNFIKSLEQSLPEMGEFK